MGVDDVLPEPSHQQHDAAAATAIALPVPEQQEENSRGTVVGGVNRVYEAIKTLKTIPTMSRYCTCGGHRLAPVSFISI